MPIPTGEEEELNEKGHELYRLVEVVKGKVETGMIFEPRFNYARSSTTVKKHKQIVIAKGNDEIITLCSNREMKVQKKRSEAIWTLQAGDKVWLHLNYGREDGIVLDPEQAEQSLEHTVSYWQSWLEKSETGQTVELGPFQEMVNRSALALKLLFYNPTGTIAAAATTSLPEEIGGVRNWDYRYTWIRDTSFTIQALFNLGHLTKSSSKLFKKKDQRLNFLITPVDPHIHFALVCASSSCPPIDIYTAENLDKELSIAGRIFLKILSGK